MVNLKHSRQRDSILSYLKNSRMHPTADIIYRDLKPDNPRLSLGTVYRNLALLADQGDILRIYSEDGSIHYDGFVAPHAHFICNRCSKIKDIDIDDPAFFPTRFQEKMSDRIEGYSLYLYGICSECEQDSP